MKLEEFYELKGFNSENILRFKSLNSQILCCIDENLKGTDKIEDVRNNMLLSNCKRFEVLGEAHKYVQSIWKADNSDNLKKSKSEGWDYYYFFATTSYVPDALLIVTNLFYHPNESEGNVLYNLVALKTDGESYFVWDMTN